MRTSTSRQRRQKLLLPKAELFPVVRGGAQRSAAGQLAEQGEAQDRVLRHTVEQIIETFVLVPMLDLDALVPQMVGGPVGGHPQVL